MRIADDQGNIISVLNNRIMLTLKKERRARLIGVIHDDEKFLYVKRNRNRHLHKKTNSYGYNDFVLRNTKRFNHILLQDVSGKYLIPVNEILTKGNYLFFKTEGFERQVFFPLEEMRKWNIKRKNYGKD